MSETMAEFEVYTICMDRELRSIGWFLRFPCVRHRKERSAGRFHPALLSPAMQTESWCPLSTPKTAVLKVNHMRPEVNHMRPRCRRSRPKEAPPRDSAPQAGPGRRRRCQRRPQTDPRESAWKNVFLIEWPKTHIPLVAAAAGQRPPSVFFSADRNRTPKKENSILLAR